MTVGRSPFAFETDGQSLRVVADVEKLTRQASERARSLEEEATLNAVLEHLRGKGYVITAPDAAAAAAQALADRVETRIRAEWPGWHTTEKRGYFDAPPIREGGATDALVTLAARIVKEEAAR